MSSTDFIEDGLTNEQIYEIVEDIRNNIENNKNTIEQLKIKHSFFEERYKSLFESVTKETFDFKTFKYMMDMRTKIIDKNITSDDASKKVGIKFYNKYQK